MTNNELDLYTTVDSAETEAPCDTCLYKKNCVFIARHKVVPKIVGCTCWESDDVEPVRHAKWVRTTNVIHCDDEAWVVYKCSDCERALWINYNKEGLSDYPYCHCGAKMDLEAQ